MNKKKVKKELITRIEDSINATPSGELRNLLTDINIFLQYVKIKKVPPVCEHDYHLVFAQAYKCSKCGNSYIDL